jgi:DNA-directed RNA polymerase subunit P
VGYRCGKCKRTIEFDAHNMGLRCPYCGSKVFYKERPTVAKTVEAR